jgi:hypothetical protein
MMKKQHEIFETFAAKHFEMFVEVDTKINVLFTLKTVMESGNDIFLVGGSVRDILLQRPIKDFDFCTSAPIEDLKKMFVSDNISIIDTGIEHGTITLHFKDTKDDFEITRFRKDISTDGRRATVAFTNDLQEDLSRRDLTINAIAWNPLRNELLTGTEFDGIDDLSKGKLRFVGDAVERVQEDHLRALRFVRFWCQLNHKGFQFNQNLFMNKIVPVFDESVLSFERIVSELTKIFKVSATMSDSQKELLIFSLKEMNLFKRFNIEDDFITRAMVEFGSFWPLIEEVLDVEEKITTATQKLKLSAEEVKAVSKIDFDTFRGQQDKVVLDALASIGDMEFMRKHIQDFCSIAFTRSGDSGIQVRERLAEIERDGIPFKKSQLAVDGTDLMKLGFEGKAIGDNLDKLLVLTQNSPKLNTKERLLEILTFNTLKS